jgi:O-antigen ligase
VRSRASRPIIFWILLLYLGFVLLLGGGARPDIQSLVILRPIAVLVCGFAVIGLKREDCRRYRFLLAFALALFLLPLLHLIPLPEALWESLPGRAIVREGDQLAGLDGVWRPLSMLPSLTWNAFYALFVPLAALLLAIRLRPAEQQALLPFLICLGIASGFLGLLQVVGGEQGPLYLYRITNFGAAVGFFANRNHQAVLLACLFPMIALYASAACETIEQARLRTVVALASGLVIAPLLLVTGSRAGFVAGLVGVASIPLVYRRPRVAKPSAARRTSSFGLAAIGGVGISVLAVVTVLFDRAEAVDRISASGGLEESRFAVWGPIVAMGKAYFPFGSGAGTFQEIYKLGEPDELLGPTYLNHAHNDWLEVFMTSGAAGLILMAVAVVAWGWGSVRIWRARRGGLTLGPARLASIILLILGLASLADYPLRVPFIACFVVIMAVWLKSGMDAARAEAVDSGGSSSRSSIDGAGVA